MPRRALLSSVRSDLMYGQYMIVFLVTCLVCVLRFGVCGTPSMVVGLSQSIVHPYLQVIADENRQWENENDVLGPVVVLLD